MENDVLRNKIAPWQEKGRWYHGIINTATSTLDPKYSDDFLLTECSTYVTSNVIYIYPTDQSVHTPLEIISNPIYGYAPTTATTLPKGRYNTSGVYALAIGLAGTGNIEFWIFVI